MASRNTIQRKSVLPPWLWLWLLFSLFLTFTNIDVRQSLIDFLTGTIVANSAHAENLTRFPWLYRIMNLVDLWPPMLFVLGALTALTPQLRAKYLEKRWRLKGDLSNLPPDLVAFVRHAAPDLQIKTNLRRSDRQAFIYPLRYRKAAIAIFRPIVLLWYNERKRAEAKAILLHEIAHYQHGDALVVGEGSFLDIGLNWWLPIFLVFGLIPMIFLWAEQSINFVQSSTGSGNLSPTLLHELIDALTIFLPGWLLILIEEILQTISLILLPLLAFWCIELNADQAVLSTLHSGEDIIRALAQFKAPSSWQDRLFALATHPPRSLRRWIARNAGKREGIWLLLMSFPLAAFSLLLGVVPLFIVQVSQESVFHNHTDLLQSLAVDIGSILVNLAPLWGVTAIILLVWPLVNSFWMRIFAGPEEIRRESQFVDWTNYRIYYFSACLTALLALWGCALYVLVQIKL